MVSACSDDSSTPSTSSASATTSATSTASESTSDSGAATTKAVICVDYPRSDTDFWNSYIQYVPQFADELGIDLKTTNSQNDVQKLIANVQACQTQGAQA